MRKIELNIAVDFDNTITLRSPYPVTGELNPLAKKTLLKLKELGCILILYTARTGKFLQEAIDLCRSWEVPIDKISNGKKPEAIYFIDDRSCKNYEVNWDEVYSNINEIIKRRLWNEI
jgi:hypothetical protein